MPVTTCPIRDEHCVCCGDYTKFASRVKITASVRTNYEAAFQRLLPEAYFIPTIICSTCSSNLAPSKRDKRLLGEPFEWVKPATDHSDCLMCVFHQTKNKHYRKKGWDMNIDEDDDDQADEPDDSNEDSFDLFLAGRERQPSEMESSPVQLRQEFESSQMESSPICQVQSSDFLVTTPYESRKIAAPIKFTATGLDNFAKEFQLSKSLSIKMSSKFNDMHLLGPDCRVRQFDTRSDYIQPYFSHFELKTVYCNNVAGLFRHILQHEHVPEEWRMGIDGGKGSFKIVLADIGK